MKKPELPCNKFKNLSKEDWKEANEISKSNRGINGITREEVFQSAGKKTVEEMEKELGLDCTTPATLTTGADIDDTTYFDSWYEEELRKKYNSDEATNE